MKYSLSELPAADPELEGGGDPEWSQIDTVQGVG